MSLKNEPVSIEIESCAPSYEQGNPVGLFIIRSPYDNGSLVIIRSPYDNYRGYLARKKMTDWYSSQELPE